MPDIAQVLDGADFHSVSVHRSPADGGCWQANLQAEQGVNSYRVAHGSTPAEAIAALFEPVPVWLPPCPVPLPA